MFDQAIADAIIEQIASGASLRETGTPSSTICTWAATIPSFAEQYARAFELRAEHHARRIEDIADAVESGQIAPDAARASIDARKWIAAKLRPKVYGDRVQADVDLNVTVTIDDPRINALQAKLAARALPKPDGE